MFRESLKRMVESVEGGVAGLLMGFDGIAVDSWVCDGGHGQAMDIDTLGGEFSHILSQAKKAADILEVGNINEVTVRAEKLTLVFRVLSPDYFIALALNPEGNFGKGRYLVRVTAPKLVAEL